MWELSGLHEDKNEFKLTRQHPKLKYCRWSIWPTIATPPNREWWDDLFKEETAANIAKYKDPYLLVRHKANEERNFGQRTTAWWRPHHRRSHYTPRQDGGHGVLTHAQERATLATAGRGDLPGAQAKARRVVHLNLDLVSILFKYVKYILNLSEKWSFFYKKN